MDLKLIVLAICSGVLMRNLLHVTIANRTVPFQRCISTHRLTVVEENAHNKAVSLLD